MVQIDLEYQGGLRCSAVHGPSGTQLITDAPVDNHGKGESFSPTDLCAAALASCMMTIMGIQAEAKGWKLEGAKASVEKEMSADLPRRIAQLTVTMNIPGQWDDSQKKQLERAAHTCPVHHSLHPDIKIVLNLNWPDCV